MRYISGMVCHKLCTVGALLRLEFRYPVECELDSLSEKQRQKIVSARAGHVRRYIIVIWYIHTLQGAYSPQLFL